jgi:hypothetical protein
VQTARNAGFEKPSDIHGLRLEGSDKPGFGAKMMQSLADAGISFRAISATALGRKFVCHLALDSAADVARAASLLRKLG